MGRFSTKCLSSPNSSAIELRNADALADVLSAVLGAPLVARSWRRVDPQIQQMLDLKIAGLGVFFAICVLMMCFGVVSSLLMSLFEHTREFGVMLAATQTSALRSRRRVAR